MHVLSTPKIKTCNTELKNFIIKCVFHSDQLVIKEKLDCYHHYSSYKINNYFFVLLHVGWHKG